MNEAQARAVEIVRGFITAATTPGGHIVVFRGLPDARAPDIEAAAWQLLDAAGVADVMLRVTCDQCSGTISSRVKYRSIAKGAPFSWDALRDVMTPEGSTFADAWDDPYSHESLCSELTEVEGESPELAAVARLRIADWFAEAIKAAVPKAAPIPAININARAVRRLAQALIDELPDDTPLLDDTPA